MHPVRLARLAFTALIQNTTSVCPLSCPIVFRPSSIWIPVAPPGATMRIGFDSDEVILEKLRARPRRMSDEELIKFGKDVRKLAENPFQRQLEAARAEWKRRKTQSKNTHG